MPDEGKTGADGTPQGQRAGNLIFGPEEPRAPTGPKFEDVLADIDKRVAEGKNPLEGLTPPNPAAQAPLNYGRVEETPPEPGVETPPEGGEAAEEVQAGTDGERPALPEGWSYTDSGRVKRPDGTWADKAQLEAIRAGKEPSATAAAEGEGEGAGAGEEGAGEEGAPDPKLVITLAGHEERGEEDVEIVVEDEPTAERLRRLQNDAMRGQDVRRQQESLQAQRDELDYVLDHLKYDASGFFLEHVTKPEVRKDVALDLMTDPDVFKAVMDEYGDIAEDADALDAKRTKRELLRLRRSQQTLEQLNSESGRRKLMRDIGTTIGAFATEVDEAQRQTFERIAWRELAEYVRANKTERIAAEDVPLILHKRGTLQLFGLSPDTGSQNGSRADGVGPTGAKPRAAQAAAPPAEGAANGKKPPVNARKVGEGFRQAREAREAAAAVAPAGVGASPSKLTPPAGQGVPERLAWLEQQTGRRS
jgi:hypothetical protein